MPMTKVKARFQVTIPPAICQAADPVVGDDLEVAWESNLIVLKPQVLVKDAATEAAVVAGLRDYRKGRVTPAFSSMEELEAFLMAEEQ